MLSKLPALGMTIPGYNPPQQKRGYGSAERVKNALVYLLSVDDRGFHKIRNQDMAKQAGVNLSSLYQWFSEGKDTVIMVLAAESLALQNEVYTAFFTDPKRVNEPLQDFVVNLDNLIYAFYQQYPGTFPVLHMRDAPIPLQEFRNVARKFAVDLGVELLKKRGMSYERSRVALTVNDIFYYLQQRAMKVVPRDKDSFEVHYDEEARREMIRVVVSYLESYPEIRR
jgi:AcrR family transcriptional regulator